jgi:hypothetical protein
MKEPSIQPLLSAGPEQLAAYASALQQMLVVHTVKAKHEELIKHTLAGDARSLPGIYHPDFICVDTQGNVSTAKEEMENLNTSRVKIESNTVEKYDVYPFGSQFAIAVGVARTQGTYDGKDISGTYKFFQLWAVSSPSQFSADSEDMALVASVNAEA